MMQATVTLNDLMTQTGLSRQSIFKKAGEGILQRVGKNAYTKESADALIQKRQSKMNTVAPTKSGVTKEKLELLTEMGILKPDEHGRYLREDIALAKKLHISHRKDGRTVLTVRMNKPSEEGTMGLGEMEKLSGIKKATLLHYIRSGKIAKVGQNEYSRASFNKFVKDYNHLLKTSYLKSEVMEQLCITNDEFLDLLHSRKLEKASFERYTKKSVNRLKRIAKENWATKAPVYKASSVEHTYTGRELADDEVMTYQEVKEALNRGKSTIVHLVKEGKIELVGRNRYAKDTVMAYLEKRDGKPVEKEPEPIVEPEPQTEYYTAKEVKKLLGIGKGTHLSYYVNNGMIQRDGKNLYTKNSVDRYIEQRNQTA